MVKLILILVFEIILFITNIEYGDTLIVTAILGLVICISVIISIIVVIYGVRNKKRYFRVHIIVISTIAVLLYSDSISNGISIKNKKTLNKVILLIEEYRRDNLKYPSKVEDLIPKYIETLPKIRFGFVREVKYKYRFDQEREYFTLTYPVRAWSLNTYYSKEKQWEVND